MMFSKQNCIAFVTESNAIEGIYRIPTPDELEWTEWFMNRSELQIADLEALVHVYEPGVMLRQYKGLDVQVGNHVPPPGGRRIKTSLNILLQSINEGKYSPWEAHCKYETLHPFMDGNGRTGRAIWAWMMFNKAKETHWAEVGFLHSFYYQTLGERDQKS